MVKYPVTYTTFDGETVTEELMFHISKVEASRLDAEFGKDGLQKYMEKIAKQEDTKAIFDLLYKMITMGYGEKSEDGRRFVKSPEKTQEFVDSLAFDALFEALTSKEGEMEKFFTHAVAH